MKELRELETLLGLEESEDDIDLESLRDAAARMVDQTEKRREAGKYSAEERVELEKKFLDSMIKLIRGELGQ